MTDSAFKQYRHPVSVIGRALNMTASGKSTREISAEILKKCKVKVSHKTVWMWINTFFINEKGIVCKQD